MTDHVRVLQSKESLTLILKNTHFVSLNGIALRFNLALDLPVLIVKFPETAFDFLVVLSIYELGEQAGWLNQKVLKITLELMDTVIADRVSQVEFILSEPDTLELINAFLAQKKVSAQSLIERKQEIEGHLYRFL